MGDKQYNRLKGRALIDKLNNHLIVTLIIAGFFVGLLVASVFAILLSPGFILITLALFLVIRSLLHHLKHVSKTKSDLSESHYSTSDKSYVWDLENTRDKLMGRLLQEGICPWGKGKCDPRHPCFCDEQKADLKELDIDVNSQEKIILSERDAKT